MGITTLNRREASEKIKASRLSVGWTQRQLAQRSSIATGLRISNYSVSAAENPDNGSKHDYVRRALLSFLTGSNWTSPSMFVMSEHSTSWPEEYRDRLRRSKKAAHVRESLGGSFSTEVIGSGKRERVLVAATFCDLYESLPCNIEDVAHGDSWYKSAEIIDYHEENGKVFLQIRYSYY